VTPIYLKESDHPPPQNAKFQDPTKVGKMRDCALFSGPSENGVLSRFFPEVNMNPSPIYIPTWRLLGDLVRDNTGPLAGLWNLDKGCWVATTVWYTE